MGAGTDDALAGPFRAGPASFVVACPNEAMRAAVTSLFSDLETNENAEPTVIEIHDEGGGRLFGITVDGPDRLAAAGFDAAADLSLSGRARYVAEHDPIAGTFTADGTLAALVTAVSRLALDVDPQYLHLHAAAMTRGGRGVLVVARSGTGKSTLAAALGGSGWAYLTDEAVTLDPAGERVTGFAKPLVVDSASMALLGEPASARVSVDGDGAEYCLPASAVAPVLVDETEPTLLVLLEKRFDVIDAPPAITPVHPTDAVVALMGQTLDAERFGPDAVHVLARLATHCRCVGMTVGPLDASVATIGRLLDELVSVPTHTVRDLGRPAPGTGAPDEWRVPDAVRSVLVDDRVVIHDTVGGTIVALDEAGTAVWQALHGDPPGWWTPDLAVHPNTTAFLAELAAHRLLDSVPAPAG